MAFDLVILFMRVTNRTWPANDIVDVFPIAQDPGSGALINPKHALMIVRNIPRDVIAFPRIKALFTQINLLDDNSPEDVLDRRRWQFLVDNLPNREKNDIRNKGRVDIEWDDLAPVLQRKEQGVTPSRIIQDADLG